MVRIKAESNGEGLHRILACKWDKVGDPKCSFCSNVTCKRRGKTDQRSRHPRFLPISAIPDRKGGRIGPVIPERANSSPAFEWREHMSQAKVHPVNIQAHFLNTPEAALFIGLSARTLEKHRIYGTGPVYHKIGGRVLYSLDDLKAWCALGRRESTSDHGVGTVHPARPIQNFERQSRTRIGR